ncbi:MAG: hypothetical protein IPF99_27045 [Deltaproteobacteria bacterium]|nr:hypothetical protein [Deltaproteobacteria bacterium]
MASEARAQSSYRVTERPESGGMAEVFRARPPASRASKKQVAIKRVLPHLASEPGVVKGKFSYLAPETAMGDEADAQADIFAVGIMLWEMLAGRKLFQGETDYQTVKMVQQAVVPSLRSINPAVPEELENISRWPSRRTSASAGCRRCRLQRRAAQLHLRQQDARRRAGPGARRQRGRRRAQGRRHAHSARTAPVIDQLIQEELLRFTSLDDPHSPSPAAKTGTAGSNPNAEGARPLDAGDFENVGEWASDLLDDGRPSRTGIAWESPWTASRPPSPRRPATSPTSSRATRRTRPSPIAPSPKPPGHAAHLAGEKPVVRPLGQPPDDDGGEEVPGRAAGGRGRALLLVGVGVGLYVKGVFPH